MLGCASKLLAQFRILRGNANRASVLQKSLARPSAKHKENKGTH